jgi:hypothetical protein
MESVREEIPICSDRPVLYKYYVYDETGNYLATVTILVHPDCERVKIWEAIGKKRPDLIEGRAEQFCFAG